MRALALLVAAVSGLAIGQAAGAPKTCLLVPGALPVPPAECIACHAGHLERGCHPVDVSVDEARSFRAYHTYSPIHSAEEVVRRGLVLIDGRVTCFTCHDGNSPHPAKLVLPPGTVPRIEGGRACFDVSSLCRSCHEVG